MRNASVQQRGFSFMCFGLIVVVQSADFDKGEIWLDTWRNQSDGGVMVNIDLRFLRTTR